MVELLVAFPAACRAQVRAMVALGRWHRLVPGSAGRQEEDSGRENRQPSDHEPRRPYHVGCRVSAMYRFPVNQCYHLPRLPQAGPV